MGKKNDAKKSVVKKSRNLELLYMAKQEVTVKELEQPLLNKLEEIHVWPEIGIMELTLPSGKIADVEILTDYMTEEEDLQFMQEREIKSVYAMTIEEDALEELIPYVQCWIADFGGFLCSDSDDFTPFYIEQVEAYLTQQINSSKIVS